jgi:DNA-binding NarL/FixJ family response regulator
MISTGKQTSAGGTARILLADDHVMIRDGVRAVLSMNSKWQICGEAKNGKEAVEKVEKLKPHLVVLDISMPVMNGVDAAREIRRISPGTKILIFSMVDAAQLELAARQAGADAFVGKTEAPTFLLKAVERLVDGDCR